MLHVPTPLIQIPMICEDICIEDAEQTTTVVSLTEEKKHAADDKKDHSESLEIRIDTERAGDFVVGKRYCVVLFDPTVPVVLAGRT